MSETPEVGPLTSAILIESELQQLLNNSDRMCNALEAIVEKMDASPTTVSSQYATTEPHPSEEGVLNEEIGMFFMPDGRAVPKGVVDAIDEYESTWPGATFPTARAAIAWQVLASVDPRMKLNNELVEKLEGLCLDDPGLENTSPCVLYDDHETDHKDAHGGTWLR